MAISDGKVMAALRFGERAMANFFLMDGHICMTNDGKVTAKIIDDAELALASTAFLRGNSVSEYPSIDVYIELHGRPPLASVTSID